jgi:aminoglycoside 2''-phosphotransferase
MHDVLAKYTLRIREICPDLTIESLSYNHEGLINDVVIVNGDTVFRFAKDEYGLKTLATEIRILDFLRPHVSLTIPSPFYVSQDVIAYPLVPGETLTRNILSQLSEQTQQKVADQLAEFLKSMHTVPIDATMPTTSAPVRYEDWLEIRRKVETTVYPLLMAHQIEWAHTLFESFLSDRNNFAHTPCLIHGDLGPYHILFDRQSNHLQGIIDFGVAGVGDPATDLGNLLQVYGESFVSRIQRLYPQAKPLMPRARFYAQAIELEWALTGITSGETLWFVAHLGGARDLRQ